MLRPVGLYRLSRRLHVRGRVRAARLVHLLGFLIYKINLPPEVEIGRGFAVGHFGVGVIAHPATRIGDDVFVHPGVIFAADLPSSDPRVQVIGSRVTVGAHAVLLGPITVGDDVVIGAGAIVTRDIPPGSVVAGVPAQVIGRHGASIQKLGPR